MSEGRSGICVLMADIRSISFYQGLKVDEDQEKKIIKLFQPIYIDKILIKFHLNKAHFINIRMKKNAFLHQKTNEEISAFEKKRYQRIIGSLIFFIIKIRPNIALITLVVSRFAKNPRYLHIKAVKTILRYMKGLKQQDIIYKGQEKLLIKGYSNFN